MPAEWKEIEERVVNLLQQMAREMELTSEPIGLNDDLGSIGMNSMNFIRATVVIEQEFDIEFDVNELDFQKYPDIQSIVTFVISKAG